jgi:hypothetical protein
MQQRLKLAMFAYLGIASLAALAAEQEEESIRDAAIEHSKEYWIDKSSELHENQMRQNERLRALSMQGNRHERRKAAALARRSAA